MADYGMNLNVPQMDLGNIGVDVPRINALNAQTMAAKQNAIQSAAQTSAINQETTQKRKAAEQEVWDRKAVQTALQQNLGEDGEVDWTAVPKSLSSIPNVSPNVMNEMRARSEMLGYASGLGDDEPEKWYMSAAALRGDWDMMSTIYSRTHGATSGGGRPSVFQLQQEWGKDPTNKQTVLGVIERYKSRMKPEDYSNLVDQVNLGNGYTVSTQLSKMGFIPSNILASIDASIEKQSALTPGAVDRTRRTTEARKEVELAYADRIESAKQGAQRKAQLEVISGPLGDMMALWDIDENPNAISALGGIGGTAKNVVNWGGRLIGKSDERLEKAVAMQNNLFSGMARGVQGEKGVLTDQDVERVKSNAFKTTDSPQERRGKTSAIKSIFSKYGIDVYNDKTYNVREGYEYMYGGGKPLSAEEAASMLESGALKSGDHFIGNDGEEYIAK